jgi:hypothetical protein
MSTITEYFLYAIIYILPKVLSLILFIVLARSFLLSERTKPRLCVCVALVILSGFICATKVGMLPGPFISFGADILPVISGIIALMVAVLEFAGSSIGRRIGLSLVAFASIAVIGLVILDVVSYWSEHHARGALVGW